MRTRGRWTILLSASLLMGALVSPQTTRAGVGRWTPHSPTGADIESLAIAPSRPSVVYAGTTEAGLFKSSNGGRSWSPRNKGIIDLPFSVPAIDIHPTNHEIVFIAAGGALYRTKNGGQNWTQLATGTSVSNVVVDPVNPNVVYATAFDGLYKSTNGGNDFTNQPILESADVGSIDDVLISDAAHRTIYARTATGRMQKSTNAGNDWDPVNSGLPAVTSLRSSAINPKNEEIVYLGTSGDGMYKTTNGGTSWDLVTGFSATESIYYIAVDPTTPKILYVNRVGQLHRSSNGGNSFENLNFITPTFLGDLVVNPNDSSVLFVGTNGGLYRSTHSGESLKLRQNGIFGQAVGELVGVNGGRTIYAGGDGPGIFRTKNGGLSWQLRNGPGLFNGQIRALAAAPTDPQTLYAGAVGGGFVFKTTNGGGTWDSLNSVVNISLEAVAVSPADKNIVLAGGYNDGPTVYRTTAGNDSFTPATGIPDDLTTLSLVFVDANKVYAGTNAGVYRSLNAGSSFGNPMLTAAPVYEVMVAPDDLATAYAATGDGVFKTTNGGLSWDDLDSPGLPLLEPTDLELDPLRPNRVYAATRFGGVWRSDDGGETWKKMNLGFDARRPESLLLDRSQGAVLHAGRRYAGVSSFLLEPKTTKPTSDFQSSRSFFAGWSAAKGHGVESFDARARGVNYKKSDLGPPSTFATNTSENRERFTGQPGRTYCFDARARGGSKASEYSARRRCTIVPLDDRALTDSGDWTRAEGAGLYEGTRTSSSIQNATLTLNNVKASRIALLVTKCPTCGTVAVSVGGATIDSFDLSAPQTRKRRIVEVYNFPILQVGFVEIRVTSTGAPVHIDGLALSQVDF